MTDQEPKTHWQYTHSCRFSVKYFVMEQNKDRSGIRQRKIEISKRKIEIANHPNPRRIGGCITCPEGEDLKLEFDTGLSLVYQFTEPKIRFVNFYYN